jgi:hypothetical protein
MSDPPRRTERRDRRDDDRPHVPFRDHVRSFTLLGGGRELVIDRRFIAFLVPDKNNPATTTVIGLRSFSAKPIPVEAPFEEIKRWWMWSGEPAKRA